MSDALTEREQEILHCLAEGLSNQEIAHRLHLAEKTVRWYNSQIYSKLGVSGRNEAVEQARARGLLGDLGLNIDRHNLPLQTTAFVGRLVELVEIARLLKPPDMRLLTILAPGGMGKTRLALEAARGQIGRFADGVYFVPLAPLSSPDHIMTTIAEALEFNFYSSSSPVQQLLDFLQVRDLLLVLDNFEHLLDAAGLVSDIIRVAPQVRVLVTSREKLNVSGETVFALSGLMFSDWETPEDALDNDAVQLFMQYAQRARPDFAIQAADLAYLARICRLTAGMPLALVLAAGWVDVLTLRQIADELQEGIDILETELRDVPERQRSVRASFNYTWARLGEAEREVFMKLAVFRGGFTAEAAQSIAGANPRHLRRLVDKALVQASATGRYDIHELLRQYAAAHLLESGLAEAVNEAHSRYFLDYLRSREADIHSQNAVDTLNAIDDDRENIYTAWRWAVAHEEAEAISQSAEALSLYFMTRTARQIEAEPLFRQAKAGLDFKKFPTAWSRVAMRYVRLKRYGMFASTETFLEDIERCLANAEAEGDLHEIAICKKALALQGIADDRLKNEIAFERMREALSLWERTGRPYYVGNALKWLGNLAADHDIAMAYYEQSVAVAHEAGLHHHAAYTLIQIALTRLQQGRYQDAEAVYQEAISSFVALADRHLQTAAQASLCLAKFLQGQVVEARELFAEAVRIRQRYGLPDSGITEGMRLMLYSFDQDSGNQAPQLVGHVPAITPAVPFSQHVYSTGQLIQTYLTENSMTAWDAATERLRSAVEGDSLPFTIVALTIIAMLLADGGKLRRAVELLSLALNHPGSPRGLLESWSLLNKKHAELEVALGADAYAAAWDRGQTLDLDHVIEELIVEFDGEQAR